MQISAFLVIFCTRRTSKFERVWDWKVIRYICPYYHGFKVFIIERVCDCMINIVLLFTLIGLFIVGNKPN